MKESLSVCIFFKKKVNYIATFIKCCFVLNIFFKKIKTFRSLINTRKSWYNLFENSEGKSKNNFILKKGNTKNILIFNKHQTLALNDVSTYITKFQAFNKLYRVY